MVAAALAAADGAGQKLGIADSPPGRRGQSAGQIKFCLETMSLVGFTGLSYGRSARESGQSAVESRILSREVVVSGGLDT